MSDPKTSLPRYLVYGADEEALQTAAKKLQDECVLVSPESLASSMDGLLQDHFRGVCVVGGGAASLEGFLLEAGGVLELIPEGVALLDVDSKILWANQRLREFCGTDGDPVGQDLFEAFCDPELLGPDFCPLHTALGSGETAISTFRSGEKRYYELEATPILKDEEEFARYVLVMVRDQSAEMLQKQKLDAIYNAGMELGDLSPQEVVEMSLQERIDLLKSKILHYTQDILEFDTCEIRLIDRDTAQLKPLLSYGMVPDAQGRALFARARDNGVTGFVAATGKSYLCEDTTADPLYLQGAPDARSSLTVPLVLHDGTIGTFNVESPRPGGFDTTDLQFLELFSREVAFALNTLELLVAQKANTVAESRNLILREVAEPVDEILTDIAWIMDRYIGHDQPVAERLHRVLQRTRQIREQIQKVGADQQSPVLGPQAAAMSRPALQGKRVLVADSDKDVRSAAHTLLGRYGCVVETAQDGEEAVLMVRTFHYDVVIADIRLPDMNGFECFREIREVSEHQPVILMTGFGYDPTHSIVKARQLGLKSVLFKPFRLDQLLTEVEQAVQIEAGV